MLQHTLERLEFNALTAEYHREKSEREYESKRNSERTTGNSPTGRTFTRRYSGESALFDAEVGFGAAPYPNRKEVVNGN